jgi:large subunit ribosomal protein L9
MKVILKEDVETLGKRGETVKVSDGFARNYLIPKGLAIEATNKNVKSLEHEKTLITQQSEKKKKKALELQEKYAGVALTIAAKTGEQGKLFGAVTSMDIEKALAEQGFEVVRKSIVLDEPIKSVGEYAVKIKLFPGIATEIKLKVVEEA